MEHAQNAYKRAKTAAHDLGREARAPILDELKQVAREAEKRLAEAQAERERIGLQMLNAEIQQKRTDFYRRSRPSL